MTAWIACSRNITMQTQCTSAASLFHIESFYLLLSCLTITSCFMLPTISIIFSRLAQGGREFSPHLQFSWWTLDLNSARAWNIPYLWCNNLYNCHPHARFDPVLWYTYSPKWPLFYDAHICIIMPCVWLNKYYMWKVLLMCLVPYLVQHVRQMRMTGDLFNVAISQSLNVFLRAALLLWRLLCFTLRSGL